MSHGSELSNVGLNYLRICYVVVIIENAVLSSRGGSNIVFSQESALVKVAYHMVLE